MNTLNLTARRLGSRGIANKISHDFESEVRFLQLRTPMEFQQEFTRLQEELSENHKSYGGYHDKLLTFIHQGMSI